MQFTSEGGQALTQEMAGERGTAEAEEMAGALVMEAAWGEARAPTARARIAVVYFIVIVLVE